MRKYAYSIFFAGLLALPFAACGGGGGGGNGKAALLSAFPDEGFAGRTTTLVLVGESTDFSDASSVDFGEGVTVQSVTALGSTGLEVQVSAAVDAAVGPRDITVDGLTLAEGFEIASPTEVEVRGTPAQGSYSHIQVTNLDVLNPFDLTTDQEGNYVNLGVTVDGDASVRVLSNASPFELTLELAVDIHASPGGATIEIASGPAEEALVSRASIEIAENTPVTIEGPGTIQGEVANGFDSVVYELTVSELSMVTLSPAVTEGDVAFPYIDVLAPSGSFKDLVDFAGFSLFGPRPFLNNFGPDQTVYLVLFAGQGEAGYRYSFDLELTPFTETVEHSEPNDTTEKAQTVVLPGGVIGASFDSETDVDWYAIDVPEEEVGQGIRVSTGGYGAADPVIEIFAPDGETPLAEPADGAFFDRTVSWASTEPGLHYVKISSSDFGPTIPEDSNHTVVLELAEPAPEPEE